MSNLRSGLMADILERKKVPKQKKIETVSFVLIKNERDKIPYKQ